MKNKTGSEEERNESGKQATFGNDWDFIDFPTPASSTRREFMQTFAAVGGAALPDLDDSGAAELVK